MINMQNIRRRLLAALLTGSALTWLPVSLASEALYDTVILKGRVIDPETDFNQIANLGIKDGQIAVITSQPIEGSQTIDASGRVVSPGFIDILSLIHI